jgi:hypothetical protein
MDFAFPEERWLPKSVLCLREYNRTKFVHDLVAGITVGLVALQLLKLTKTDISIWLVTFGLTVFADLTVAVEAGMILAALLFISRVASTTTVSQVTEDYVEDGRVHILQDKDIPYYATIFRIHGPFLFGATDKIHVVTENIHKLPPVVILRLRNLTGIDATGWFALEEVAKKLHESKRTLILCGAREQPSAVIHQAEFRRHHRAREHLRKRAGSAASSRRSVRETRSEGRDSLVERTVRGVKLRKFVKRWNPWAARLRLPPTRPLRETEWRSQQPRRQHHQSPDQLQNSVHRNAHDAEGKQQQPDEGIEHQGKQSQRPAHHKKQAPQEKCEHDNLRRTSQ